MKEKIPYSKPSLTIEEQIEQLKNRGMIFESEAKAAKVLERIQYARLRPYWHPFESYEILLNRSLSIPPATNETGCSPV